MKTGWKAATFRDVCSINSALVDPREAEYSDLLHVGGANIESSNGVLVDLKTAKDEGLKSGKFLFDESTVLYSKIRPYLMKVARPDFRGLCSADIYPLTPKPGVLARDYLFHVLLSPEFTDFAVAGSARAGMPKVNRDHLFSYNFLLPPLAEQQRIVGILDEAFEGIATAKANAEKNLQNARALFESHLQSVFTQRGEGWVDTTVGDQLTLQRGFDITKSHQNDGRVPVVSSGGIKSFHDTAMVQGPGVVIGRKGTLGKVFYLEDEFWPHDTTLWVKDFKGNYPRFVYYLFAGLDVKKLDSGAANPALNRNQVHPMPVTWPPISQQRELAETLDLLSNETQRLASIYERKLAALDELKKSLLHQAFSGEL